MSSRRKHVPDIHVLMTHYLLRYRAFQHVTESDLLLCLSLFFPGRYISRRKELAVVTGSMIMASIVVDIFYTKCFALRMLFDRKFCW